MGHRFSFRRQLLAQLAARLGLAVESLSDCRWAAHLAQKQHFHLKIPAVVLYTQQVAHVDFTRGLGGLTVGLNSAKFTGARGERARLEEASGPQPLVDSHAVHDSFSYFERRIQVPRNPGILDSMSAPRRDPLLFAPEHAGLALKPRKAVPYEFVLDAIGAVSPKTRPMFGCLAVYVKEKIVLILRDKRDKSVDNGVWLATTEAHHDSLRGEFPHMRSIQILGKSVTGWQVLPADAPDFEEAALRACELILAGDPRIGKVPGARRGSGSPGRGTRPAKRTNAPKRATQRGARS
jgi:hypothetical protein